MAYVKLICKLESNMQIEGKRFGAYLEDEMVRQHHQLNGHEFEQTPGDSGGEEPGRLQSLGSQRVGHDLMTEQQQKNSVRQMQDSSMKRI